MANVPTVTAPTVSQSGAPLNINAPAAAFGANVIGGALESAGKTIEQHSNVLADHALRMAAEDAKMQADQASDLFNVKANEVQTALFNQQGVHARDALPGALKSLADLREQTAGSLTNPAARRLFTSDALNSSRFFESAMAGHAGQEWRQAVNASAKASLENKMQFAAQAIGTPGEESARAAVIDQVMYINDQIQGGDAETFKATYTEVNQKILAQHVEALAAKDPALADRFVDAHEQELGDKYGALKLRLQPAVQADEIALGAEHVNDAVLGPQRSGSAFIAPVGAAPITSGFGPRKAPGPGASTDHKGVDYGVPVGTPVHAAASGTVVSAGPAGGYGNMVEVRHPDGSTTRYGHLSEVNVKPGQAVGQGTVIAKSGRSGNATGPNLHFEVRRGGVAVDPNGSLNSATGGPMTSAQIRARRDSVRGLAAAEAERLHPGDASFALKYMNAAITQNTQRASDAQANEQENWAEFSQTIQGGGVTDQATLLRTVPDGLNKWNSLPPASQLNLQNQWTGKANEMTTDRQLRVNDLTSLRDLHPAEFAHMDLTKEDLPLKVIGKFQHDQNQIVNKAANATQRQVRVNSALGNEFVKRGYIAAGLVKDTPEWRQYTGALSAEMELWYDDHPNAKTIPDKDLASINARILAKTGGRRMQTFIPTPFGDINLGAPHVEGSQTRVFAVPKEEAQPGTLPSGDRTLFQQFHDRFGRDPDPNELAYYYRRKQGA